MNKKTISTLLIALGFAVSGAFAADVAASWGTHCADCHGVDGRGNTKMGKKLKIKDLTDAAYQDSFTDEAAFKAVREGVKNEAGKTTMKAIPELSDEEINALVAYVRGLKK